MKIKSIKLKDFKRFTDMTSANVGNDKESFMMDVLAPRIQPGMKVYEELHEDIFGSDSQVPH